MRRRIIATYLISSLFCVWVGSLRLLSRADSSAELSPAGGATSLTIHAAILSDSWPIKKLISNPSGDLVFAGGEFLGGADGLVLIKPDGVVKLAATGDAVPGREGLFLAAVGIKGRTVPSGFYYGEFALNTRDLLVFSARVVRCGSSSEVTQCAGSSTQIDGLFVVSEKTKRTLALEGDPAPGTVGGRFSSFERVVINDDGAILFEAKVTTSDGTDATGLFLVSAEQIEKVFLSGDETAFGKIVSTGFRGLFLSADGAAIFDTYVGTKTALLRHENGVLSKLASDVREFAANKRGDVVFRIVSSVGTDELTVRRADGRFLQILRNGDTTPVGGQFALVGMASLHTVTRPLSVKIDDAGDALFASQIGGATVRAGLFRFRDGTITKIAADGDPTPGESNLSIRFDTLPVFASSPLGVTVFSAHVPGVLGGSALFAHKDGRLVKVFDSGTEAPGTEGGRFAYPDLYSQFFSLSDTGETAFPSEIWNGKYWQGIFVASLPRVGISNGGMETAGERGLPASWPVAWTNEGSGEAFRYADGGRDPFSGESVLRLHVSHGGGSTFVLSEPITVSPDSTYWLTSRMRFYLTRSSDSVAFTVLQFDSAGQEVGIDEVQGKEGQSFWTWTPKGLLLRTTSTTTSIRIRFGLSTSDEAYLDVDDVR